MTTKNSLSWLVAMAVCATAAVAQPAPPPAGDKPAGDRPAMGREGPDKAEMQKHFAEMCLDRKAHAVGEMAALEVKLGLTAAQKPLFERWKKIKLAAAETGTCSPPPDKEPSIIDGLKEEQAHLAKHLAELKAELPALEALVSSLSDEQKAAFRPPHPPRDGKGPGRMGAEPGFGPPPPDGPPPEQ